MRTSNTTMERTGKGREKAPRVRIETGIHWLDASLNITNPYQVLLMMGLNMFVGEEESRRSPAEQGWYCYWHRLTTRYCDVLYDNRQQRPARLIMTGKACERYQADYGSEKFLELIVEIDRNAKLVHRIDPYLDEKSGLITIQKIQRHFARKAFRTYMKQATFHGDATAPNGPPTFYLGSKHSNLCLRIYDKGAELRGRRMNASPDAPSGPHLRFEIQARDIKAREFTKQAAERRDLPGTVAGVLAMCLTLTKSSNTDSNPSRWPVDPSWTRMLQQAGKIKLTGPARSNVDEPLRKRIGRSRKNIAAFVRQYGTRALWQEIVLGDAELKPRHLKEIALERRPGRLDINAVPASWGADILQFPTPSVEESQ